MSKKIMLINADHPEECRAVILENGKIEEFIVEHSSHEKIKGNIYLGVINRIEPAIEAAFVDFGGKKYGFLPFKDVLRESYIETGERKARTRIQDVLVRGQRLLLQVAKEGRDAKGPSLTNSISIPGRFLVLMSGSSSSAISRKIEDESERKKLREIISEFEIPESMGLIIRTAGVGRTKTELQKDLQMLLKIWENIQTSIKTDEKKPPFIIYQEADMVVRTVRDHFTTETSEIIVDNPDSYKALKDFFKMIMPRMRNRVKLYQEIKPLFSQYRVEEQLESIYHRKVSLPSGGSIVFDQGEAMVTIDVNSGKTTSASQLEETAVKTNLEAADEIARQLRLRDLGGLIVIDFIDMFHKKNQTQVEKQLKKACKIDKARVNFSRISKFGLLEMSRQRMSPPIVEGTFTQCIHCDGTGHVRSLNSTVLSVLRKISENLAGDKVKVMKVVVSAEVVNYLLNYKTKYLKELQEKYQFTIEFASKPYLDYEDFEYLITEKSSEEREINESRPRETRAAKEEIRKSDEEGSQEKGKRGDNERGKKTASGQRRRYSRRPSTSKRTPARGRRRKAPVRAKSESSQPSQSSVIEESVRQISNGSGAAPSGDGGADSTPSPIPASSTRPQEENPGNEKPSLTEEHGV